VGNTVDVATATCTNSISDALMMTCWQDQAFDPEQRAFLIRAGAGNPDAAVDHLRRGFLRCRPAQEPRVDSPGTGLHLADLVHAVKMMPNKSSIRID
jgi:hypothetical protein